MTSISQEYSRYLKSSAMKQVASYALQDSYFGQTSSVTFEEIDPFLSSYELNQNSKIFDAGCGNGCFDNAISKKYGSSIFGLDLSLDAINEAKALYSISNQVLLQFSHGDFMQESFYPTHLFDLILSLGSLYWGQNILELLKLWRTKASPQGRLLIFTNLEYLPINPLQQQAIGHTKFIQESYLKKCLEESGWMITNWLDRSRTYLNWLERFNEALDVYKQEIMREMSSEASKQLFLRFKTYKNLAQNSQVKRIIVEAKHATV